MMAETRPTAAETRLLGLWLLGVCAMIAAMAVIGAITRLTESGLSITVWEPLTGWRWPMGAAAWQEALDLYRDTPQYRLIFAGMSLAEFQWIFFWEWFHRLWGRLIGLVVVIPLAVFWLRGMVPGALKGHMIGLVIAGGFQGFIGWYMVQSGLVAEPSVSHYRLALHLGVALILFAWAFWLALHLLRGEADRPAPAQVAGLRPHMAGFAGLLAVTIIWGAFVAGLDAGMIYNEFPLMGGRLLPSEAFAYAPWAVNLVENHATVQFIHRWLGMTTGALGLWLWWRARARLSGDHLVPFNGLALAVLVQIALGITTLLMQVHMPMAVAHQAGALILIAFTVWTARLVVVGSATAPAAAGAAAG